MAYKGVHVRKVRLFVSTIAVKSMDDRSGELPKGIRESDVLRGKGIRLHLQDQRGSDETAVRVQRDYDEEFE